METGDFTDDQKNYLQGFLSGAEVARAARGVATFASTLPGRDTPIVPAAVRVGATGPDAIHIESQDRVLAAGGS